MTGDMNHIPARIGAMARAFMRSKRGNVAMMFGIALVPITVSAGVGLDYARAALARSQMSDALDAAALAVGSTPGLTSSQVSTLAQKYFNANYKGDTSHGTPTVGVGNYDTTSGSVTLNVSYVMDTAVLKAVGVKTMPVTTSTTVVWGQSKLWVALVLDNSGSMSSSGKMSALISASHQLLSTLQSASSTPGDVEVGIVPFVSVINVGKSKYQSSWIDWSDWDAAPVVGGTSVGDGFTIPKSGIAFDAYGPGDDCPFTTTVNSGWSGTSVNEDSPFGYDCVQNSTNGAGNVSTSSNNGNPVSPIPAGGNICPGVNQLAYNNDHLTRYFNGCWTSSQVKNKTIQVSSGSSATCGTFSSSNCSCSGKNNAKKCKTQQWSHNWVPNAHSTWNGCIMDRAQDYDIHNTQPSGSSGMSATNTYPSSLCLSPTVSPLGYDWNSLNSQVDNMTASGSTNQPVGLASGWQMLTPGNPYGTPSVPPNTTRYIILLSDGLNTQDRWWGNGQEGTSDDAKIDDRMDLTCTNAKADGIVIYTLYVNIGGANDSVPLQKCATDSSKYFKLTSASQISTAFATIAAQITNVRVSK
mgnify:CR=1 FL=1|jgi:Flp pilus assembly protein TadG